MKQDDVFPSKYLRAEELDDEITLTINKIEMTSFEDNKGVKAEKPVAYFKEIQKGLVINKTNWKSIAEAAGEEDSDNWIGKQITLFVMDVASFGDTVSGIRVKKTTINRAALLKRYHDLLAKAETIGIEGLEDFKITEEADEATIIDAGKQLRALIVTAEAF
jgi:hypothetical protein